MEIVEDLFADYAGAGALVPAWRWELADRGAYARRSLTTQYQESDFQFLERLLAEEGFFYWFEHAGAAGDEPLGRHTLVLCDHGGAFAEGGAVRYHRADATEREDGIQRWSRPRRWQTGKLARASWDYRSLGLRPAEAEGEVRGDAVPEDSDTAGPMAGSTAPRASAVPASRWRRCRCAPIPWKAAAPGGALRQGWTSS